MYIYIYRRSRLASLAVAVENICLRTRVVRIQSLNVRETEEKAVGNIEQSRIASESFQD